MSYSPSNSTFPTAKTTFTDPESTSDTSDFDHAGLHSAENDAIEKLETVVGITGSADTNSHDYKIADLDATKAEKTNVLELDNTDAFTPDADYEPATKKYVDDTVATENELSELNDVVIDTPADNEVLAYDNASSKWINQTASEAGLVSANTAITGATKTKITYDAKGLVTGGADATTADIADSTDKRYVSDAQLVVIGNTSNTNTGDEVEATGAELDTGTDQDKYASAKAIKDSHNVPSVAPGTSGNLLTSNGTDWTSAAPPVSVSVTTKGDLQTYSTTPDRLPVSATDGHVLTVDATTATGLKWAAPAASGDADTLDGQHAPTGTIVGTSDTQLLTNKSVDDYSFSIVDNLDNTKVVKFLNNSISTGTTRTWTFPNADDSFVGTGTVQTLTNKTLTSPKINGEITGTSAPYNSSMARQAIINGNFDVWQRGTSLVLSSTTFQFLLDHWADYHSPDGGTLPTLTRTREAEADENGSYYYSKLAFNGAGTSLGNNSVGQYAQSIEYGTRYLAGADKKVTVSFWAKSDVANKRIGIRLLQNYGTGGSPSSEEIINGTNFTLTSTWTKYTYTFTTNTLSGKTFGTANDDKLTVAFAYMWGSTRQAQYGSTSSETYVGAGYVGIKKVQLCAGDVALPFMPKSKTTEEDDCIHFYRIGQFLGIANTTSILVISNDFATKPLRTAITTSNFKIYTTKANAIAEVAQQALTTPGVGDTNITQSSYIVNEVNGVIGLQLSGTPLTAGRAYSGYYVINQEI